MKSDLKMKYYSSRPNWIDGTTQFRGIIESELSPDSYVLDVGAGAGRSYNFPYQGKVARVVGVDVSKSVMGNPCLDEAFCCDAAKMPFSDAKFDVAFSDYVFEHLPNPKSVAREIFRVLKPNGIFCLRTPNKWHYIPLMARLLPNRSHPKLLDTLSIRSEEEVFPKYYRANTTKQILEIFLGAGFQVADLHLVEKEPFYFMRWPVLFRAGVAYERIVNSTEHLRFLRSNILGAFRKPA
jgi:SAM-dependent methyltransferase